METLSVTEYLPEAHAVSYIPGLYNSRNFLEANNTLPQLHFYLINNKLNDALGHIAFSIEESEATSPFKAPFAGFDLAERLDSLSCTYFLQEVLRRLVEKGFRYLRIKMAPGCYQSVNPALLENIRHLGFEEKERQIYHAILVNGQPLTKQIASMEQRRLRKAAKEGLEFKFASKSEFPVFFDFIKRHREAKGHRLSMGWRELRNAIKGNEESYLAAGVYQQEELIAASILIRASAKVIYNFFPANNAEFNSLSPMVFLLDSVYSWCQQQEIGWIDLGTSYLGKKENKPLVSFKEHMGGQPFESITFRKTLSS